MFKMNAGVTHSLSLGSFVLGLGTLAHAQSNWVDFQNETAGRLSMTSVNVNTDAEEKDLEAADFDNDGDTDLVIVRKTPFTTMGPRPNVLLMNEGGVLVERTATLAPGLLTPDDTRDIVVFDMDNDGWLDMVTGTTWFDQPRMFINQGEVGGVWQGFAVSTTWMTSPFSPAPKFCSVVAGDVNNDGFDDLFFSDYENNLNDRLVMNNGDGTFTDESPTRLLTGLFNSTFGTQGHIVDLNGDGWNDIINTSGSFDPPDYNYNNGAGVFTVGGTFSGGAVYQSGVGDFDNDDDIDVYIADDGQDYIFFNDGVSGGQVNWSSSVAVINSFKTIGFNHHNHPVDIDRDGWIDQGNADVDVDIPGCGGQFSLLQNRLAISGNRGFHDPNNTNNQPWNTFGNYDFAWIDVNGDGCLDMVQGLCSGYELWIQTDCDVVQGPGVEVCNGDGGDQMGCTNCPCGNDSAPGTIGGCLNSSGNAGRMLASGGTSVSAGDLRIEAQGMVPNSFAVLTSGGAVAPNNASNPCFGLQSGVQSVLLDGLRCAVAGTLRHGGRPVNGAGEVGTTGNGWGPPSGPPGGIAGNAGFAAGVQRHFQIFYRELPGTSCGTEQNTSQAVSVTFTP